MTQQPFDDTAPPESLSPTPEELSTAGEDLAAAASELGVTITAIEQFLSSRNITVPAWVRVKGWEHESEYWFRDVGYDMVAGSWHLAIRERKGDERWPEDESVWIWSFNNSPRKARISAVDKLPELLKALIKEAERTARRLRDKTVEINAFAATLNIVPPAKKAKK